MCVHAYMNVGRSVGLGAIILAVLLCFPVYHFAVLRVQTQCLERVRQMPHCRTSPSPAPHLSRFKFGHVHLAFHRVCLLLNCVYAHIHECVGIRGICTPGTEVTNYCKSPNMDTGNQTQVLHKSGIRLSLRAASLPALLSTRDQTQGIRYAGQTFLQLSHIPSHIPFL